MATAPVCQNSSTVTQSSLGLPCTSRHLAAVLKHRSVTRTGAVQGVTAEATQDLPGS